MDQPGRVVTTNVLASLVGEAWSHSFTPLNILSGFRKCGIQPLCNPTHSARTQTSREESPPLSPEKIALFEKRYEEGYDMTILSTKCD